MALKFKYTSKDLVPVEQAALYVERDGSWVLDVDGAADKSKLDEFRSTNVALLKERDDLRKRKRVSPGNLQLVARRRPETANCWD